MCYSVRVRVRVGLCTLIIIIIYTERDIYERACMLTYVRTYIPLVIIICHHTYIHTFSYNYLSPYIHTYL